MSKVKQFAEPKHLNKVLAEAKFKRFVPSSERASGGAGYWAISDVPFEQAATELFRSAIRACKPAPVITTDLQSVHS